MIAELTSFVSAYAGRRRFELKAEETPGHLVLTVFGCPVQVVILEEARLLAVQVGVGLLPDDPEARRARLEEVLAANNLFAGTGGATLGYDRENDLVTLQIAYPADALTDETLGNLLDNFLDLAAQWLGRLAGASPEAAGSAPGEPSAPPAGEGFFIRP